MFKCWLLPILTLFCIAALPHPAGDSLPDEKLVEHARLLKVSARNYNCSTQIGILIDMSISSRKKRLFIINLQNDSVLLSGICAHGQGSDVQREEVVFSNKPGSNCTSQGRYKLGAKFVGEYGTGYRLYGLDSTNSNAFKRNIVFHAYYKVADDEDANMVCRSNGCPMVSPKILEASEKLIDAQSKPVMMWIYK